MWTEQGGHPFWDLVTSPLSPLRFLVVPTLPSTALFLLSPWPLCCSFDTISGLTLTLGLFFLTAEIPTVFTVFHFQREGILPPWALALSGPLFNIYVHHLKPHEDPVKGKRVEESSAQGSLLVKGRVKTRVGLRAKVVCHHRLLFLLSDYPGFRLLGGANRTSSCSAARLRDYQEKSWGAPSSWFL